MEFQNDDNERLLRRLAREETRATHWKRLARARGKQAQDLKAAIVWLLGEQPYPPDVELRFQQALSILRLEDLVAERNAHDKTRAERDELLRKLEGRRVVKPFPPLAEEDT